MKIRENDTIKTEGYKCSECGSETSTVIKSPEFTINLFQMEMIIKCADCGEESTLIYEAVI